MASKKQKKGRNLILLLILMVVLIGALVWVTKYNDKKESSESSETTDDSSVVVTLDTTTISTIHFKTPETDMTLSVNEEGTWLNALDQEFPVNQTYASAMASAFASITATRTMTDGIEDLSTFGLDNPTATISATLNDNTTTTIEIGNEVPVLGGYYATVNEDGKVYVLPESFYTTFDYTLQQMAQVETIPAITAENITKLSIINKDKDSFEVVYDEDSPVDFSGYYNYIINKPYETPQTADSDAITTLFGNYSSMTFSSCVDYNATDLSKYGLDNPSSEIQISYYEELTDDSSDTVSDSDTTESSDTSEDTTKVTKVNHELTLLIGGTDENGNYYAKLADSNTVNIITASSVSTLTDIDVYENTNKYTSMVNIGVVDSLDIEVDGAIYHFTIERTTETVDEEETEVDTYYLNDVEMEEDTFKTLYQSIIGITTERAIPDGKSASSQDPYMTVTFHMSTSEEPIVIKYMPYDKSYYVVDVNGVSNYLVDMRNIKAITDDLKEAQ